MPVHRLTVPTYFGGLPATHDYINDPPTNGDAGVAAPMDGGKKVGGPNEGTYLVAQGEDATAFDVNRLGRALTENDDFFDDLFFTSQPTPVFAQDLGAGQTKIQITADVFVGKSGLTNTQENRDLVMAVIDSSGNVICDASGTQVVVSEIRETTDTSSILGGEATGFHTDPWVYFNVAMPAGVTFRVLFFTRGNFRQEANANGAGGGLMGDLAGRLWTNVGKQQAWTLPFVPALSLWNDASSLASTTGQEAIDEIVDTLATASGSDLIGGAAYVGASTSLSTGSIQDQLRELADELAGLAANNTFTGTNVFSAGVTLSSTGQFNGVNTFSNTNPFDFDHATLTTFGFRTGSDWEANVPNGNIFFDIETALNTFQLRDGSDNNIFVVNYNAGPVTTVTIGRISDGGVADAYAAAPHRFASGSVSTGSLEAHGLAIGPGSSDNAGSADGTFLRFDIPGSGTAGGIYGVLGMNFNGNEGAEQRRTYVPTLSYLLLGGGAFQQFAVSPGGVQERAAGGTSNAILDVEAIVLARGDTGAGVPNGLYGKFRRRATFERTAGTYTKVGATETEGTDQNNFSDLGGSLVVDLVNTTSGPRIQVTPPSEGGDDAVWWGLMIITALGHTDVPDA